MGAYDYDCLVVGGGAAGLTAAFTTSGLGKKTALVEQNRIGGECTWMGCIPSKTLLKAAKLAARAREAALYGIGVSEPEVDGARVMARVRSVMERVYKEESPERLEASGIHVLKGRARFLDAHRLLVDGRSVSAEKIILAAGTAPRIPKVEGLMEAGVLTNETFFDQRVLPESLAILGAGAIAMEMAQAMNRLGVRVTVLQRSGRILSKEDPELAALLKQRLESEGVRFVMEASLKKVDEVLGRKVLTVRSGEGEETFEVEAVFAAAGRIPRTQGLDLEKAGVAFDEKGIRVDGFMKTTASNIWACGDVAGPWRFSHMAYYQGVAAGRNAALPFSKKMDYGTVGWCLFTDPELAHLGMTEEQARQEKGSRVRVHRVPFDVLDRAVTDHAEEGLAKIITDPKGRILGAHILGARAGELIHELSMAKAFDIPLYKLQKVVHIYPTYSDLIRKMAQQAYVDRIREQPLVKLVQKVSSKKEGQS